jgi:hypothetical protein
MEWDTPPIDLRRAKLELWRRKIEMDDEELGIGARSLDTTQARALLATRYRYGNAVDWHPAQQ